MLFSDSRQLAAKVTSLAVLNLSLVYLDLKLMPAGHSLDYFHCPKMLFNKGLCSCSGAVFIKQLKEISYLSENFKCIFLIYFQIYFNESFHAYEKQRFS